MVTRLLLGLFSLTALSACGSHNHATAASANDDANRARIFNTPHQLYRHQQANERIAQASAPAVAIEPVSGSEIEAAKMRPIAAVYSPQAAAGTPQPATTALEDRYIKVEPGDTVYAISRRYGPSPQEIIAANNLSAPYLLSVGQTIRIPGQVAAPANTVQRASPRANEKQVVARDTIYTVQQGDTLYSISRASKTPVAKIADANNLKMPYNIGVGQRLFVPNAQFDDSYYVAQKQTPANKTAANSSNKPADVAQLTRSVTYTTPPTAASPKSLFRWPVKGAIISNFGSRDLGRRNDGVNIAAPAGTPVRAAADGDVVYSGSELDGFGNLLLIKHIDGFVTAYAHNDTMLVKKGDKVRQGQVIAKVGQSGAVSSPQLHFEIRQNLKSVDPVALLGSQ